MPEEISASSVVGFLRLIDELTMKISSFLSLQSEYAGLAWPDNVSKQNVLAQEPGQDMRTKKGRHTVCFVIPLKCPSLSDGCGHGSVVASLSGKFL